MLPTLAAVAALMLALGWLALRRRRNHPREAAARWFRGLLDAVPDAILVSDSRGVILKVNASAERLFAAPRALLLGRLLRDLVPAEGRIDIRRLDASLLPAEVTLSRLDSPAGPLTIHVVRDLTERRRLMADLAIYQSLVTHDVCNFATSLLVITDRLMRQVDGPLNEKQLDYVRRANRQGLVVNHLAENVRGLMRIRGHALPPQETVRLDALFDRILPTLRALHFDRPFDLDRDGLAGMAVRGVPLLDNVVFNLCDNAIRYSPRDAPILIRVSASRDGAFVRLAVRGGVPPEPDIQAQLFAGAARGPRSTGSGLGLALVRDIVEQAGGRITANPVDGTFEVSLWLPAASAPGLAA